MKHCEWKEHELELRDHRMHWYECGSGAPVLFLHGCYDTILYRPLADLFSHKYRCVLYDQRGAASSALEIRDDQTLHVDRFVNDLECLRHHLGIDKICLIGHSWGATLAALYGGRFPERVGRLVLIGMGPIDQQMHAVYKANALRMIAPDSRDRWRELCEAYRPVVQTGAAMVPEHLDEEYTGLWTRVMFYFPRNAERFTHEYMAAGGYRRRPPNPRGFTYDRTLSSVSRITAPALILYGYQDYEPITQAFVLQRRLANARVSFLNECGHAAWADQPEALFEVVDSFLSGHSTAE